MFRKLPVGAVTALSLALAACGLGGRTEAPAGIAAFLAAAQRGDRAAFEAAIDRAALRTDLRNQLIALGRTRGLDVDGGPSEFALDRMITPGAFHLVDTQTGEPLTTAPTAAQVAPLTRDAGHGHVCVRDAGHDACVMTFAREKGAWRLVGMQAGDLTLQLAPAPPKG